MKSIHRLLLALASLLLIVMYVTPLWIIELEAPQYPEGLGLEIHLSTIVGQKEQDLESINNLNHYIGMKRIEPDSIQELTMMPWIVAAMIGLGLISALVGKRWMALSWSVLFIIVAAIGMADFYNWEYDYGHNLNPHAAISIPGMSYQPPLIGGKQLLNFHALSLPGIGGYAMGISIALGLLTWFLSRDSKSKSTVNSPLSSPPPTATVSSVFSIIFLPLLLVLSSCSDKPEAISFGTEECAHCKMTISDKRFGAELVTKKGKNYKFDSIECLCGFLLEKTVDENDIATEWVIDYAQPGQFIPARKAWYLRSEKVQSPMGLNLSAYSTKESYESSQAANGGDLFYFDSVRLLVAKSW